MCFFAALSKSVEFSLQPDIDHGEEQTFENFKLLTLFGKRDGGSVDRSQHQRLL